MNFAILALSTLLTAPAIAQQAPAVEVVKQPQAQAKREGLQVFFLKPKAVDFDHLEDMAKVLEETNSVRRVRIDRFSRSLIVQCAPAELPEAQRIVSEMEKGATEGPADRRPLHVALDVRVVLASATGTPASTGILDPKLVERLRSMFGYGAFEMLGTQLVQVKVNESASSETTFRAPGSNNHYPFALHFKVRDRSGVLEIEAELKAIGQAVIKTTFVAQPNKPTIIGNSTLKSGEALIYIVTPRVEE